MCGIAGFNFNDKQLIRQMNQTQAHRGPDGEGFYTDDFVSLGHRRLAIIDLSEQANQPMFYEHFTIVFNGEIYNFKEIKEELIQKNHVFITNSDTEVILHAYQEWSFDCVNHFNGMWAFCVYDKKQNILFLSRDRFGIKPLYYYFDNESFIFASEIKAIRCHNLNLTIDNSALNHYFYQKYIGADKSIFNEIKKLAASHNLIFNISDKQLITSRYYVLENEILKASKLSLKEKKSRISALLVDAVEKRLISDVPVGSFLSGGVDSSLISAIIAEKRQKFNTFSIGFKEVTFNELDFSIKVSKHIKTDHFYRILDIDTSLICDVITRLDEPFGDPSLIPTFLLSKITREKVTVSLSGDAGDEIFGGYDTYKAFKLANLIPAWVFIVAKKFFSHLHASEKNLTVLFKISKFFKDFDENKIHTHLNWMSQTDVKQRIGLLNENYVHESEYLQFNNNNKMIDIQLNDIENYLPDDILRKVDIASMLASLEARVPFLDFRLVPIVLSLPDHEKIKLFTTKYLLKKIAEKYLPSQIIKRKKQGFSVPISKWIKQNELLKDYLTDEKYFKHQLINKEFVFELYQNHLLNKEDNSRPLWLVFVFNYWWKNVYDDGKS